MINIRPISDLRNHYTEIENIIKDGNPVYLTKNGYGTMVVLSIDSYASLLNPMEKEMDIADFAAAHDTRRLSGEDVFDSIRGTIRNGRK